MQDLVQSKLVADIIVQLVFCNNGFTVQMAETVGSLVEKDVDE